MAEGRKEGKQEGVGEGGRKIYRGRTWIPALDLDLCSWMSLDVIWSWSFSFLSRVVGTIVSISEDYLLHKWDSRHEKHRKVIKSSLLLWFPESGPIGDLVWYLFSSFTEVLNNFKWDVMWDVMNSCNVSKNNAKAAISIHELVQTCFIATRFMFKTTDPRLPEKLFLSAPPRLLDFL